MRHLKRSGSAGSSPAKRCRCQVRWPVTTPTDKAWSSKRHVGAHERRPLAFLQLGPLALLGADQHQHVGAAAQQTHYQRSPRQQRPGPAKGLGIGDEVVAEAVRRKRYSMGTSIRSLLAFPCGATCTTRPAPADRPSCPYCRRGRRRRRFQYGFVGPKAQNANGFRRLGLVALRIKEDESDRATRCRLGKKYRVWPAGNQQEHGGGVLDGAAATKVLRQVALGSDGEPSFPLTAERGPVGRRRDCGRVDFPSPGTMRSNGLGREAGREGPQANPRRWPDNRTLRLGVSARLLKAPIGTQYRSSAAPRD